MKKPAVDDFDLTGPVIATHGGSYCDLNDPARSNVTIDDVAQALSKLCRFTGHCEKFYSVAEHSVHVSHVVPADLAYDGLMHDIAEAFINDISTPLKMLLPEYKLIEARLEHYLFCKFDVRQPNHKLVKHADLVMLATEKRDLLPRCKDDWPILRGIEPLRVNLMPLTHEHSYIVFMERYDRLRPHP